jgi:tetratricopeptide (TPR) repeat protein
MGTAKRLSPIRLTVFLVVLLCSTCNAFGDDAQADALLQQGRVDEASAMLLETLAAHPDDARAHQLLCRVYYAQDLGTMAVPECELAVANAPTSSENEMWLARAYGLKASQANPLVAFGIAKKVRVAFERAVQLDPANIQAMSDLGEFYVAAPSIVGGGLDKAQALAVTMMPRSAWRTHRLLARIAVKQKDFATAETEFKAAVATGKTPQAYVDLAQFYHQQNRPDQALAVLQGCIAADRRKDAILVDAASLLIDMHRSLDLAASLLRDYLSSPAKSDEAPAFKIHLKLGDLLSQLGDKAGARQEYGSAVALASNYVPAHKALQGT